MADEKVTDLTELSIPALTDLLYAVGDPGGTPTSNKLTLARAFGLVVGNPQSRLSTESGVAAPATSDRTAQGTLYDVPCIPSGMATGGIGFMTTWDGTRRRVQEIGQVNLSLTLTSGKNYDVFRKNSDLSLVLSNAWTNDTTRADALATAGGLIVADSDNTYVWRGTIRASASNVTADSGGATGTTQVGGQRFVWNSCNQIDRPLKVIDTDNFWSYATATIRQAQAASGNKVEYVTGDAKSPVRALLVVGNQNASAGTTQVGVGVDSTTTFSGLRGIGYNLTGAAVVTTLIGEYAGHPGLGYHYLSWNEIGAAGGAGNYFYGDAGDNTQSGLIAWLMG